MSKRTKVPRASLACTMLDDAEYMELVQDHAGIIAYALFTALLMAAKNQENGGVFESPDTVIALMVRWPLKDYRAAVSTLKERTDWIESNGRLVIRSYEKWNSGWGGKREGAGRKNSSQGSSSDEVEDLKNQDCNQVESSGVISDSDSDSDSESSADAEQARERGEPIQDDWYPEFSRWWKAFPAVGRKNERLCQAVWRDSLSAEDRSRALEAVARFAAIVNAAPADRQAYFTASVNWLRNAAWNDSPEAWKATAGVNGNGHSPDLPPTDPHACARLQSGKSRLPVGGDA